MGVDVGVRFDLSEFVEKVVAKETLREIKANVPLEILGGLSSAARERLGLNSKFDLCDFIKKSQSSNTMRDVLLFVPPEILRKLPSEVKDKIIKSSDLCMAEIDIGSEKLRQAWTAVTACD